MEGKIGTINWSDGTSSRVLVKEVETYSCLPTDYWLEYLHEETHRPIIHPDYEINPIIKSQLLLPEGIFFRVFVPDITEEDKKEFSYRLNQYIKENFREEDYMSASGIFDSLKHLKGEDYIIKEYLEK
jgi:hypothetical protein